MYFLFYKILNVSPNVCASKEEYRNLHFKARSCQHFLFFNISHGFGWWDYNMPYNLPSGALIGEQK